MADLGKAYVQIMPSAKGIKGQVEKILGKDLDGVGESAGRNLGKQISSGLGSIGSTLTKAITLPVAGAVAAATGFLLKGGWDRIVGLDSARAQLEGLGYDFQAVERISSLVNESIQGTTMTMADGVSVAAGALAAGVAEGEELERFIGLVGDAAIGSGREVNEMAQIFNRVQGSGKLMTQELNMIEQGMPGFAQAMADSFGVGQDEFREMVTAGEVSSAEFLDVMDDFAGGMSDAYSKSWTGIFSRVKSNLAILGEYMLEGLFPDAKEALADFLETIREDDIRSWAKNIGETIGDTFRDLVTTIKDVIEWWGGLSDGSKQAFKTLGTIVVVLGPMLTVLSKVALVISKIIGVVAAVKKALVAGKVGFALFKAGATAIMGPVGWITALLAGLVAGGIALYMNWDTVKEKAQQLGDKISEVWDNIKAWTSETWDNVKEKASDMVDSVKGYFSDLDKDAATSFSDMGRSISNSLSESDSVVMQKAGAIAGHITDNFDHAYGETGSFFGAIGKTIEDTVTDASQTVATKFSDIGRSISDNLSESDSTVLQKAGSIAGHITDNFDHAYSETGSVFGAIRMTVFDTFGDMVTYVKENSSEIWNSITEWFGGLPKWFAETWNNIVESVTEWAASMGDKAAETGTNFVTTIEEFFTDLPYKIGFFLGEIIGTIAVWAVEMALKAHEAGMEFGAAIGEWFSQLPERIETWLTDTWERVSTWATNMWGKAEETGTNFFTSLSDWFSELPGRIETFLSETWNKVSTWATNMWNKAKETGSNVINALVTWFSQLPGRVNAYVTDTYNRVTTWASNMWTKASEAGSRFINNILNWFQQLPGRIQTWLTDTVNRVTTWAVDLASRGKQAGADLLSAVITEARKIPGRILNVGKDVVKGFWNGITSMGTWLRDRVGEFFGGIVDGVKSKFEIFSPSRVFRDEIGVMIPRGFGDGITKGEDYAIRPLEQMMDDAMGIAQDTPLGLSRLGFKGKDLTPHVPGNNQSKSTEVNVTNNIYSPKALTAREVGKETERSIQRLAYRYA